MNTTTPPEPPKLAPCPFCGGAAMTYPRNCNKNTPYNAADRAFPIVRCMACWAEIAGTDWSEPRTAIAAWNRRAPLEGEKAEPVASPVRDAMANLISEQAEDDALWFEAEHIAEAYFQQELRRLHAAVESALASPPAPPVQPVQGEPVAWRVRGYNQFKTGTPGPWRYFDGRPDVNGPDYCDIEPLYAAPSPRGQPAQQGEARSKEADATGHSGERPWCKEE